MIDEFDKLRKYIKSNEGKKLAIKFRKQLKSNEKYKDKLYSYLTDTLDGIKPESSANKLKLL